MTNDVFPKSEDMGARTWGNEILLALVPGKYTVKRLEVRAGEKGGLQYHHLKNECGYILSGKLLIRYDNGKGILKKKILTKGKCFHFPPGSVHQEEAITNVKILEASSPHFNDRVRVEHLYNLELKTGLPTTAIKEVKTW